MTAVKLVPAIKQLRKDGISKRAIAKQLGVNHTSDIRLLRSRKRCWKFQHQFRSRLRLCRVKAQLWKLPPQRQNGALDNP
jgi:IS30 family transposase